MPRGRQPRRTRAERPNTSPAWPRDPTPTDSLRTCTRDKGRIGEWMAVARFRTGAIFSVTEKGLGTDMEEDGVPTPAKWLTCLGTPSERSGGYWEAIVGGTGGSHTPFYSLRAGAWGPTPWTDGVESIDCSRGHQFRRSHKIWHTGYHLLRDMENMKPLPHLYEVALSGGPTGYATLIASGVSPLRSAPPKDFDGPGDAWSPEHLLLAAVETCFMFTFRAVAQASKFDFVSLALSGSGTVDRKDGTTRFTEIALRPRLTLPRGADPERARRMLEKGKTACLVTASLSVPLHLEAEIVVES